MLCFTAVLLISLLCILFVWLRSQMKRPYNYPPGPRWMPIVGNSPQLQKSSQKLGGMHRALGSWAAEHGSSVLGLRLGNELVVVLFGRKLVREALEREEFDGRPDNFFMRLRTMGSRLGITCTEGRFWAEQRSFVMRHLKQIGYGKQIMEERITNELKELIFLIDNSVGTIRFHDILSPSVLNVLWTFVAGKRLTNDDPRLKQFMVSLRERSKAFDIAGGLLNQMPWLRFIIPERSGYNLLIRVNKELHNFFEETILEHHINHKEGQSDDLIHAYLTQMENKNGKPSTFSEIQLRMVLLDIFLAGSQTTGDTLDFAFLMMIRRPDLQKRAQQEIDSVLGTNLPEMKYKNMMPFVEAIILEVHRYFHIIALSGPRRVTRDTTLAEYNIPKDTTVLMSLYSVHKDEEYWDDPEVFRPERFIDAEGRLKTDENVIPFGLGRRRCLGELLAKSCLFLFFTGILQKFELYSEDGTVLSNSEPISGITLTPRLYETNIRRRTKS